MRHNLNLSEWEVQLQPCRTCPFEGSEPIDLGDRYSHYVQAVITLQSQHFCHSSRQSIGDKDTKLCRGGRNLMLKTLTAKGVISEPTDAAFEAKRKEVLGF